MFIVVAMTATTACAKQRWRSASAVDTAVSENSQLLIRPDLNERTSLEFFHDSKRVWSTSVSGKLRAARVLNSGWCALLLNGVGPNGTSETQCILADRSGELTPFLALEQPYRVIDGESYPAVRSITLSDLNACVLVQIALTPYGSDFWLRVPLKRSSRESSISDAYPQGLLRRQNAIPKGIYAVPNTRFFVSPFVQWPGSSREVGSFQTGIVVLDARLSPAWSGIIDEDIRLTEASIAASLEHRAYDLGPILSIGEEGPGTFTVIRLLDRRRLTLSIDEGAKDGLVFTVRDVEFRETPMRSGGARDQISRSVIAQNDPTLIW